MSVSLASGALASDDNEQVARALTGPTQAANGLAAALETMAASNGGTLVVA